MDAAHTPNEGIRPDEFPALWRALLGLPARLDRLEGRIAQLEVGLDRKVFRPLGEIADLSGIPLRKLKEWAENADDAGQPFLGTIRIGKEVRTSLELFEVAADKFTTKSRGVAA